MAVGYQRCKDSGDTMTICAGCGFSLDGSGNFGITGVTNNEWPYTAAGHTNPDGWYCDTGTDGVKRLWHQPWNLPWGKVAGATGSGTGAWANGIGPQNVCQITVTFKKDRCYLMQGTFFYNADVRTMFDWANPAFGGQAGGCIYNTTNSLVVMSQTAVSTGLNFSGTVTLNYYFENNTGADITKTYAWRSLALGVINARPASSPFTGLVCHDVGPRL
jgi:hypothetical protein